MSARAWRWRRSKPPRIPRAENARTRRAEQLARRRARRQGRRFDTWAHRGWFELGATEQPWGTATWDVMADLRAAGWPARPLEETPPL